MLVTGGNGQLGHDVVRAATPRGWRVTALGSAELDVTDTAIVDRVVNALKPEAIVHCAAWTAVDDAETNRDVAFFVNETGSRNVARAAQRSDAYLIGVSTDYVFAGDNPDGYVEADAVDPINVYGASKLAGELALLEECPTAAIGRTAWLFGADGENFVRTIARLADSRDTLDIVNDQVGSPTWTLHLANALIDSAEQRLGGILHLAGSPTASWYEVAQEVVNTTGARCELNPVDSSAFLRPAKRPACSILRAARADTPVVGDWREGVRAVLSATTLHA
jgi:dTDP-4-dehydrorhamnose reductase